MAFFRPAAYGYGANGQDPAMQQGHQAQQAYGRHPGYGAQRGDAPGAGTSTFGHASDAGVASPPPAYGKGDNAYAPVRPDNHMMTSQ